MPKKGRRPTKRTSEPAQSISFGTVYGAVSTGSGSINIDNLHIDAQSQSARNEIAAELRELRTALLKTQPEATGDSITGQVALEIQHAETTLLNSEVPPTRAVPMLERARVMLLDAAKYAGAALTLKQAAETFGPTLGQFIQRIQ